MRVLSATEAITPAIDRTKAVLFQPFKKGTSWKLAATAYLAVMGSIFLPTPLAFLGVPGRPRVVGAMLLLAAVGVGLSGLMFLFFYVGARMQFVLFDLVLTRSRTISPLWKKYGFCTGRWIGLKLLLSAVSIAACVIPLVSSFRYLTTNLSMLPGQPPSPQLVRGFLLTYAIIMLAIFFVMLCSSLLNDFVLPPIALENASLGEAMRRFGRLLKTEPGQVVHYIVLKAILVVAAGIALEIGIIVAELVAAIPLGLIALLGWFVLHSQGSVGHALLIAGDIVLFLTFVVFLIYMSIGITGCIVVFFQAYSLYFLGGRYPALGDLLEPPPAGFVATAPPPEPPPSLPVLPPAEPAY